jgi:hypothetical protein
MNIRLTLPVQWSVTLLLGLFLGYTYQPMIVSVAPVMPISTPIATSVELTSIPSPAPFVTLPGGLMVRVKFSRTDAPQVEKIIHLDQARITVFPKGDDRIEILNESGQTLYSQSFLIEYLDGDPPKPVDSKTMIFVLPSVKGAAEVVITTSNGKVNYEIPAK